MTYLYNVFLLTRFNAIMSLFIYLLFYHSLPTIHWSTASLLAGIWIVTHFIPHKITSEKYQRWKIVDHPVELTSKNEHLIYLAFQQVSGNRRSFLVLFHGNKEQRTASLIPNYGFPFHEFRTKLQFNSFAENFSTRTNTRIKLKGVNC